MKDKPCFVDTNVWLYAFISSANKNKTLAAEQLVKEHKVVISDQVINELCVNLLKKTELSEADIQALILSFHKRYRVVEMNKDMMMQASILRGEYKFSFWDSLIVSAALLADAAILYTEDMSNTMLVRNKLRIINPFKHA